MCGHGILQAVQTTFPAARFIRALVSLLRMHRDHEPIVARLCAGQRGTNRSSPECCDALRLVFDTAVSPKAVHGYLFWFGKSEDRNAHSDGEDDQKDETVKAGFVQETQAWMRIDDVS